MQINVPNSQIIDIRLASEWHETGIIEGSKLITYEMASGKINPLFVIKVAQNFSKDDKIVLICHSGIRSRAAVDLLRASGFKDVSDVPGGIYNYTRLGAKLIKYDG